MAGSSPKPTAATLSFQGHLADAKGHSVRILSPATGIRDIASPAHYPSSLRQAAKPSAACSHAAPAG